MMPWWAWFSAGCFAGAAGVYLLLAVGFVPWQAWFNGLDAMDGLPDCERGKIDVEYLRTADGQVYAEVSQIPPRVQSRVDAVFRGGQGTVPPAGIVKPPAPPGWEHDE